MNSSPGINSAAGLRRLSPTDLERLGQDSLREHLLAQAIVAHQKYAPVTSEKLNALLQDPDCLRSPVRIVFEFGEMALHQFAQPDIDWRSPEGSGQALYVRPVLREHPHLLPYVVAYMIPLVNYDSIISDEHCLLYGATLLGMLEDEFYTQICALADLSGAEPLLSNSNSASA